jgi:SAM-dependent methyltransferase
LVSSDFCIEPEIAIKLAKRGARIFEIPIDYSGRTYQEGKKIGWKDGFRALWAIAKFGISDNLYTTDEHGGEILARLSRAPRFNRWMADIVRPYVGRRVLEVGAGTGNLTVKIAPREIYWATDVNPHYLETLGELRNSRPYLNVQFTDITRLKTFPQGQNFDTVICLNVLEHIEDHVAALRNIWTVLEVGGRAIVLVPQHPGLYGTLDRVLGHCRRYTETELLGVGKKCGFSASKILQFNRVSAPGWWLNGKILRKATFNLSQMKLLNISVPLLRHIDPWLPLPALSLIAIFEKTGVSTQLEESGAPAAISVLP